MRDTVIGQNLYGFRPRRMNRFVLDACYGEQFGQLHLESYRNVGIFRYDAAMFDFQQRKLAFECSGF